MSELMKSTSKAAYSKEISGKTHFIGNYFWPRFIKSKVFTHEAFNRVLSLPMRHLNINVPYVSTSTKESKTRLFRSLSISASNIIDKYESWPDNVYLMCLPDFASIYTNKKEDEVQIELDEIKGYTVPNA